MLLVVGLFLSAMRDFFSMIFNIPTLQKLKFRPADLERIRGYLKELPYFTNLSFEQQNKFLRRVISFIVNKEFIGKEGLIVNEKMKVQIAATAVQLTFGLDNYILPHFDSINIFKGEFGYPGKGIRMKGGTTESGKIYLSWKDFESGLIIPDDGYNLGLHEFAHALKIEYHNGVNDEESFEKVFPHWFHEGMRVMQEMKEGRSTFLRKYATTNAHEFFAVSVERFFETPVEFKEKLPKAYYYLSSLLRQDPASKQVAPAVRPMTVEQPLIIPQPLSMKKPDQRTWHWSLTILLAALLAGPPFYIWMLSVTDIPTISAVLLSIAAGTLNLVSWPYFREREILNKLVFSWYSYIGVGTWATVLVLALNFIIPVSQAETEQQVIAKCSTLRMKTDTWRTFEFRSGDHSDNSFLRTYYNESCHMGEHVSLTFRTGIFGMRSLQNYSFSR